MQSGFRSMFTHQHFAVAHERRLHHARGERLVAHRDTVTTSPTATPSGRRASAIDLPSVGLNVPLVISPSPCGVCTF